MSTSEVAQLRAQIELACESAIRGMTDFSIVASHEMINARMEKLGEQLHSFQQELTGLVGEKQAVRLIAETYLEIVG